VEPEPSSPLLDVLARFPAIQLVSGRSPECLGDIEPCDAYVIDGDHNYHTVSRELAAVVARGDGSRLPLIVLHDVAWPWGRRDSYYSPDLLPEDGVRPHTFTGGVSPGNPGVVEEGVVNAGLWAIALEEGGAKNGVQTAVDGFLAADARFGYIVIPCIFGLGVMYPRAAPYAGALEALLGPLQDNPLLQRLEDNRLELVLLVQASRQPSHHDPLIVEDHERIAAEATQLAAHLARARDELDLIRIDRDRTSLLLLDAEQVLSRLEEQLERTRHELDLLRVDRDRSSALLLDAGQALDRLDQQVAERDLALASILQSRGWRLACRLQAIRRRCQELLGGKGVGAGRSQR
jgi:hypothetical protein